MRFNIPAVLICRLVLCNASPASIAKLADSTLWLIAKNWSVTADELLAYNSSLHFRNITIRAAELTAEDLLSKEEPLRNSIDDDNDGKVELIEQPDLLASLNESMGACDDFYEFVCHNWPNFHEIADYETKITQLSLNVRKVSEQMRQVFEERDDTAMMSEVDRLAFDAYDKCMDVKERKSLKSRPLFDALRSVKQARLEFITDWLIFVRPLPLFYSLDVMVDVKNVSQNRLSLAPSGTFISKEYLLDDQYERQLDALEKYLFGILAILAEDDSEEEFFKNDSSSMTRRVASFVATERRIAEILNSSEQHRDNHSAFYNLYSLKQIQELAPSINWERYITGIIPTEVTEKLGIDSLLMNVFDVPAIEKLEEMQRSLKSADLSDYIQWRMILAYAPYLDDRLVNARQECDKVLMGVRTAEPLWISCQLEVMGLFPDIANLHYIGKFFDRQAKSSLKQMVDNIRNAFASLIEESDWMQQSTKLRALRKVKSMAEFIGYDESLFNRTRLEKKYEKLNFNSSWRYIDIVQRVSGWKFERDFEKLLRQNDRHSFEFPAPDVNAYYDSTHNQIALLAGILQRPFFNSSMPTSMNYGGIGVVIGHEITHGFDDGGRQYDEVGNLDNWWDTDTEESFLRKRACFVDQYNSLEVPNTGGMHIDGQATQSENIADNGGLRAAYRAMTQALKERGDMEIEKRIRGLEEYNQEQLFFINYAYMWCGNARAEAAVDLLISDAHSPDRFRVNMVLSNFDEFFRAFTCADDSRMRVQKQCRVW